MSEVTERDERLVTAARTTLRPMVVHIRHTETGVAIDLVIGEGRHTLRDYAHGPNELLAVLAAEQRFLVEQIGSGSMPGATYVDKARERVRRGPTPSIGEPAP